MKGLIFDLDGTMIDNMMVHHRAWQKKLGEYGLHLEMDEVMEKVHGINEEILERLFGERFSPEERRSISMEKESMYREIFLPDLQLVKGLDEFLRKAVECEIPMGIGTAAPPENMNFVLDTLGIRNLFHATLHARDVTKGKPDPEIFLNVADRMNIDVEECIIFEDSPTGALAASRSGAGVIVITTTHSPDEFSQISNVLRFIEDFEGLDPRNPAG